MQKLLASNASPAVILTERLRASGIGWYNTIVGLLQLIVSIVAGLLWDRISHTAVFYYGAIFAAIGSIGLLLLIPGKQDRPDAGVSGFYYLHVSSPIRILGISGSPRNMATDFLVRVQFKEHLQSNEQ